MTASQVISGSILDLDEVDGIVAEIKQIKNRWEQPTYDMINVNDVASPALHRITAAVVGAINANYGGGFELDQAMIFETRAGGSQPLHADAEVQDCSGQWGPNHSPWRTHVGLVYFSDEGSDHEGGVLRLPELDLEYPPKKGLFVMFPATHEYLHEVTEVKSGTRYALAVWTQRISE